MTNKAKIAVYDTPDFIFEEIKNFKIEKRISFIEINNVYIKVLEHKLYLFTDNHDLHHRYTHLNFKSHDQLKNNVKYIELNNCLLLETNYRNVFYHWIYDIIPQLSVLKTDMYFPVITLPFRFNFQFESLTHFKPEITIHNQIGYYKIKKLIIPNPTTEITTPFLSTINFLRNKIENNNQKSDYIYLTRKKGLKRRIINESLFVKSLKNIGFKIYNLEELSFQKQKAIFENAGLIISAHGSGLTNIVFSKLNTTIVEIYGPGCGERCYAKIALALGMNYHAFKVNKLSYTNLAEKILCYYFPHFNQYHFKINLKIFEKYLNEYILNQIKP